MTELAGNPVSHWTTSRPEHPETTKSGRSARPASVSAVSSCHPERMWNREAPGVLGADRTQGAESRGFQRLELPHRRGIRPATAKDLPSIQVDQGGSLDCVYRLLSRVSRLPGFRIQLSSDLPRGSMSLIVDERGLAASCEQLLQGREFARFHPLPFSSIFLSLPTGMRDEAISKGWAEPHPLAGLGRVSPFAVTVYAPRDKAEELVLHRMILHAHQAAYKNC